MADRLTEAQIAWLSTAKSGSVASIPFSRRVGSATKSRCERAGLVVRDQFGTYYITEAGRVALSATQTAEAARQSAPSPTTEQEESHG